MGGSTCVSCYWAVALCALAAAAVCLSPVCLSLLSRGSSPRPRFRGPVGIPHGGMCAQIWICHERCLCGFLTCRSGSSAVRMLPLHVLLHMGLTEASHGISISPLAPNSVAQKCESPRPCVDRGLWGCGAGQSLLAVFTILAVMASGVSPVLAASASATVATLACSATICSAVMRSP